MSVSLDEQSKSGVATSLCAACGEEFGCAANANCEGTTLDCWCVALKISDTKLEEMQARYQGCLCRNCLTTFTLEDRC